MRNKSLKTITLSIKLILISMTFSALHIKEGLAQESKYCMPYNIFLAKTSELNSFIYDYSNFLTYSHEKFLNFNLYTPNSFSKNTFDKYNFRGIDLLMDLQQIIRLAPSQSAMPLASTLRLLLTSFIIIPNISELKQANLCSAPNSYQSSQTVIIKEIEAFYETISWFDYENYEENYVHTPTFAASYSNIAQNWKAIGEAEAHLANFLTEIANNYTRYYQLGLDMKANGLYTQFDLNMIRTYLIQTTQNAPANIIYTSDKLYKFLEKFERDDHSSAGIATQLTSLFLVWNITNLPYEESTPEWKEYLLTISKLLKHKSKNTLKSAWNRQHNNPFAQRLRNQPVPRITSN